MESSYNNHSNESRLVDLLVPTRRCVTKRRKEERGIEVYDSKESRNIPYHPRMPDLVKDKPFIYRPGLVENRSMQYKDFDMFVALVMRAKAGSKDAWNKIIKLKKKYLENQKRKI
eukprot:UN13076